MNGWVCERCGSDDKSVKRFYLYKPWREEKLCWDCILPIWNERVHGTKSEEDIEREEFIPSLDEW